VPWDYKELNPTLVQSIAAWSPVGYEYRRWGYRCRTLLKQKSVTVVSLISLY